MKPICQPPKSLIHLSCNSPFVLLQQETGDLPILERQPRKCIVSAVLVGQLPQIDLASALFQFTQVRRIISLLHTGCHLGTDAFQYLLCQSRFDLGCPVSDETVVVVFLHRLQQFVHDRPRRIISTCRQAHDCRQGHYPAYYRHHQSLRVHPRRGL